MVIFSCTCTHTSCYVIGYLGVGLGGVGCGGAIFITCTHIMLRSGDLFMNLHTHVMLRYADSSLALAHTRHGYLSWGGVGWGGVGRFMSTHTRHLSSCQFAHTREATAHGPNKCLPALPLIPDRWWKGWKMSYSQKLAKTVVSWSQHKSTLNWSELLLAKIFGDR